MPSAGFTHSKLNRARFIRANLSNGEFQNADLGGADLSRANLVSANLEAALLLRTNLCDSNLTGSRVFGASAWGVNLEGAIQTNLVAKPTEESLIEVDSLEVAQFIYLLLNNQRIRHVIETITSKVVLILGRFTPERKVVLDALREEIRALHYLPILYDFEKPSTRTTIETVAFLAHLSRFVVADLTDAKSILQELQTIVPTCPSVVIQPLLLNSQEEPGMFDHLRAFPWVLDPHRYESKEGLLASLKEMIIQRAEAGALRLRQSPPGGR